MQTVHRWLVLTDLVDSTALVSQVGDARAAALNEAVDLLTRDLLVSCDGLEIDKTDGFLMLFEDGVAAIRFCVDLHDALVRLSEAEEVALAMRAGIHAGTVGLRQNRAADVARGAKPLEVEGLAKPLAARVMGLAVGGQTLCTEAVGRPEIPGLDWVNHGNWRLKGVPEAMALWEVGRPGVAVMRRPPDSEKAWRALSGPLAPQREALRAALAQRAVRRVLLVVGVGLVAGGAWQWDRTRTKVGEYADWAWTASGPIGQGEPQPFLDRVRLSRVGGRVVRIEAITAAGAPIQRQQPDPSSELFEHALLMTGFGAEILWFEVHNWRANTTHLGNRIDLEWTENGELSDLTYTDAGASALFGATVRRLEDGTLQLHHQTAYGGGALHQEDGVPVTRLVFDEAGRHVGIRYRDASGLEPARSLSGAAEVRIERDDLGRVVRVERRDHQGQMIEAPGSHYELAYHGDSWEVAATQFVDANGEREAGSDGLSRQVISRDGWEAFGPLDEPVLADLPPFGALRCHRVVETRAELMSAELSCADAEGRVVGVQHDTYSPTGHLVESAVVDADGSPLAGEHVWSRVEIPIGPLGEILGSPRHWSADGEPFIAKDPGPIGGQIQMAFPRRFRYTDAGRFGEMDFLGPDGEPAEGPYGWTSLRVQYDDAGRVAGFSLHDLAGEPAENRVGLHRMSYRYDVLGQPAEVRRWRADGRPAVDAFLAHLDKITWDDAGRLVAMSWYGVEEEPIDRPPSKLRGSRAHSAAIRYNAVGLPESLQFRGRDGRPTGAACPDERLAWTEDGHTAGRACFDERGNPADFPTNGLHRVEWTLLGESSSIYARYAAFGVDGTPRRHPLTGCMVAELDHNDALEPVALRCLDGEGNLTPFYGVGAAQGRFVQDGRGRTIEYHYLDADGDPTGKVPGAAATELLRYDDLDQLVRHELRGPDGELFGSGPRGAAIHEFRYDDQQRLAEATYLGPDGTVLPADRSGSVAVTRNAVGSPVQWTWRHPDGALDRRVTLDLAPAQEVRAVRFVNDDGSPVDNVAGWSRLENSHDQDGTVSRYFLADGSPARLAGPPTRDGRYAHIQHVQDNRHWLFRQADVGFGFVEPLAPAPPAAGDGYSGQRVVKGTGGQADSYTCLDAQGQPVIPADPGYATIRLHPGPGGASGADYLDTRGEPMEVCGVAAQRLEDGEWVYRAADGAVVQPHPSCMDNGMMRQRAEDGWPPGGRSPSLQPVLR